MNRHPRRRFLEDSLLAAAAVATSTSLSKAEMVVPQSSVSANETLVHAVLGCRIRGKVHAKEFSPKLGVEIGYVCDPDIKLAEELADVVEKQQGKRPKAVKDLRVVIDDKSVDTVSVATPNHWHALAAIWAMQAGKDVYVEKPVCHNVTEGRRMVQVARKTNRICQGGTQNRSRGDLAEAAKYIRDGKLGKIQLARTVVYGNRASIGAKGTYATPPNVDYNLFLGPAEEGPLTRPNLHYDWHWQWNTGNGELGNNNIHYADMCRLLLGLQGLGKSVISLGARLGYEDAGETPNTQLVIHDFGNLTLIQETRGLKSPKFHEEYKDGAIIYGSEGIIAGGLLFDLEGKLVKKFDGPSENHFENFIKAVRSRKREDLRAEINEGHQSTSLCHLGNISYRLGKAMAIADLRKELASMKLHQDVSDTLDRMTSHLKENSIDLSTAKLNCGPLLQVDSEKERFVGNDAANAMLTRNYRKPFVVPSEA